jgi:hypothetical protein
MTTKQRRAALPQVKRMLGKAAAGRIAREGANGKGRRRTSRGRLRRARPVRVRLLAVLLAATAAAAVAVSAGAFDRSPVAPQLRPEESGVKPSAVPGEARVVEGPDGESIYTEISPCIKSDPSGYSDAELEEPEWCFHRPGKGNRSQKLGMLPPKNSTDVIVVDPVDAGHRPVAGMKIEDRGAGSCLVGSDSVGHAYRCSAGRVVYDPCWNDEADPAGPAVLCQERPWEKRVYRLTLGDRGLEPIRGPGLVTGSDQPWGIELATGDRCVALQGAHSIGPGGRVVDYYCYRRSGKPAPFVLLRGIDTSNPRWLIASETYSERRNRDVRGPRLAIAKAWYAAQE